MTADLLRDLAMLFAREADAATGDPYAWPPGPAPTEEQLEEMDRLMDLAGEIGGPSQKDGSVRVATWCASRGRRVGEVLGVLGSETVTQWMRRRGR